MTSFRREYSLADAEGLKRRQRRSPIKYTLPPGWLINKPGRWRIYERRPDSAVRVDGRISKRTRPERRWSPLLRGHPLIGN
jgi:hypothetical protein